MQYTKDIILDVRYKRKLSNSRLKAWTCNIKEVIKDNRIVITTLILVSLLIGIDITLVNSFLKLLSTIY